MLEWWVVWSVKGQRSPDSYRQSSWMPEAGNFLAWRKGTRNSGVCPFQSPLDMDYSLQDRALNSHGAFSGSSLRSAFSFLISFPHIVWLMQNWREAGVLAQPCLLGVGGGVGRAVLLPSVPFFCKRWFSAPSEIFPSCLYINSVSTSSSRKPQVSFSQPAFHTRSRLRLKSPTVGHSYHFCGLKLFTGKNCMNWRVDPLGSFIM